METNENLNDKQTKKDNIINAEEKGRNQNPKKVKLFSAKEFRKQLNHENRLTALKQFINAINESKEHNYVFEYLENGGNCLELLQTLELDSTIPPIVVFELITHILLNISSNYLQYESAAYEACRYMLNNYVPVINKMINLSSTSQERKECLKLLTAMATFSPNLAKDILLQVNLHSTNVELLTKSTGKNDGVRDCFIHFLTAFLVNGNYPTLSTLLEKKGFIASIIGGLQYDSADTVCVVISAMKNHILENLSVSKTAKMKVFNTLVVRDIVNLYNWKGPAALKTDQKYKSATPTINEYDKSKVSECVHDFLLVLCTSQRFGVIFKDHLMGLGKKNQNALMYTVLESLERPWEHSYACELVTKICGACPDLSKTMWGNLNTFLEPRLTQKWLNAMRFAKMLLNELQPSCIEFCMKDLSVHQLAQVIQFIVAPLPILKTVIPVNYTYERPFVKRHVMSLLLEMLKSLESYLRAANSWLRLDDYKKLKQYITNHITKNFPDATIVLNDWESEDESDIDKSSSLITQPKFLDISFDIFDLYKSLAPQLLECLGDGNMDVTEFLGKLGKIYDEEDSAAKLQLKIVDIFMHFDQSKFSPKTKLFSAVLPLILKFYYETQDAKALVVLGKLLKNTEIFDGCLYEINIWINGVLDLQNFDESIASSLVESLKITATNILEFINDLSKIRSEQGAVENASEIIENLLNDNVSTEHRIIIKHRYLSPMILGFLNYLSEAELTKSLKVYSNFVLLNLFHCQSDSEVLKLFIQSYTALPKNIKEYFLSWINDNEIAVIKKSKGKFFAFHDFSKEFLAGNVDDFLANADLNLYADLPLNLLEAATFYLSNLVNNGFVTQSIIENCEKFVTFLLKKNLFYDNYISTILGHPILLNNVSFLNLEKEKPQSICTKFLLTVIKFLLNSGFNIEDYLKLYRDKLLHTILRILRKPQKYKHHSSFVEILQLFNLSYDQCFRVLVTLMDVVKNLEEHSPVIFDILIYCLERISQLCQTDSNLKPLDSDAVQNFTAYFVTLSGKQEINVNKLSLAFHKYFKVFPHNIIDINRTAFIGLLNRTEYNKENVDLAVFLLERDAQFFDSIKDNINTICGKKGVILPLLQILVDKNIDEDILAHIFEKLEPSFTKALQKPQKAGQHFRQNYKSLVFLVEKFLSLEKCERFLEKVQKFEVTEVFHAKLLEAICKKVINSDVDSKKVNNIILTFVHLQMNLLKKNTKSEEDMLKLQEVTSIFDEVLTKICQKIGELDLKNTSQNETLKSYFKFCLKFGVSEQTILLRPLTSLVNILAKFMAKEDSKLILDMLLYHSEFLNNILGEHSNVKLEIFSLFLVMCKHWPEFMERSHVTLLLAAYRAMVNKCDRTILTLLNMYESNANQTHFYDFKPFLWGKAAANHYSVRQNIENALWRQPKMGDVLDILQENYVRSTIISYPLKERLHFNDAETLEITEEKSYDLKFLLPLFSQLLAQEQQVQTYRFTRSGALSLTVVGLSSQDKEVRQAACHVLSRFHFHMDARQSGKDNLLWIRYIEAVCKGTALLPNFKLNNFSAIYLARMGLVLTQPNHVMYVPLSQHLTAKSSLDFSTVPELYTFLHSSDVNYKEQRNFILELLRDGLRTDKDFTDFLRSMAFKLFSELYFSCLSDSDTKLLILDVIKAACEIPLGVKMLCENHSLLTQLFTAISDVLTSSSWEKQDIRPFISRFVHILVNITRVLHDSHSNFMIFNIVMMIVKDDIFNSLSGENKRSVFEMLHLIFITDVELLSDAVMSVLLSKSEDKFCKYIFEYGCNFVNVNELDSKDEYYYLRLLVFNKLK